MRRSSWVAQAEWKPPEPSRSIPVMSPIDIQPRITNRGDGDLLFLTSNSFAIRILDADGKELKSRTVGEGTLPARPIVVPAGASFSLCRRADLRWDASGLGYELVYHHDTGAQTVIGPLAPGRYKVVFSYAVAEKDAKQHKSNTKSWSGEAVTGEVPVEVFGFFDSIRGLPQEPARLRKPANDVIRVRESKPITVNDAQFVIVAESNWKPGKDVVPIDIQFHVTNIGKSDLTIRALLPVDERRRRQTDDGLGWKQRPRRHKAGGDSGGHFLHLRAERFSPLGATALG